MIGRRHFLVSAVASAWALSGSGIELFAQARPDLAALAERNGFALTNRAAARLIEGARTGVRMSAANGDGSALIPGAALANGTIEVDLRGKDTPQQSFLGVAFHAADGSALDCVYFRPFNFRSTDPASRVHAVQYHATPGFTWDVLRSQHPGEYEKAVDPVPDPNDWFHARIVIADPKVSVYVEHAATPSLAVNTLAGRKTGLVGLWVGNGSGGDFANLTIAPA